jgi:hypothetical protein
MKVKSASLRWIATAVIVIAASAGQAQAAKKRVKPPAVDPLPSPSVYSWGRGFHVGFNAGAAWGSFDPETSTNRDVAISASTPKVNSLGSQRGAKMANFVMAKQRDGRPVWINVDQIRYVIPTAANRPMVHFDDDAAIEINDLPAVVVDHNRKNREGRH